jgi:hypothetical protein
VTIEQVKVADVAARLMEDLERKNRHDKMAEITSVILVVSVEHSHGRQHNIEATWTPGILKHEVIGLLETAKYDVFRT